MRLFKTNLCLCLNEVQCSCIKTSAKSKTNGDALLSSKNSRVVLKNSRVVRVDHFLISREWVKISPDQTLGLVHCCTHGNHLRFHFLAKVQCLRCQVVWFVGEELLESVRLFFDSSICGISITCQSFHSSIYRHVCSARWNDACVHHVNEGAHLNTQCCVVTLQHNLLPCVTFLR